MPTLQAVMGTRAFGSRLNTRCAARKCARSKPNMTSKIEHVYVYDVSVLFFDKNLLDFPFNLIQSENEVENDIHIGFSSPTHSTAKFVTVRSHSIF